MANVTIPERTPDRPPTGRRGARMLAVAVLAAAAVAGVEPASAEAPAPARVWADFGSEQGRLSRPERFNNFGNVTAWPAERADDVAFLNEQGLHGDVYRVWLSSPNAPAEDNIFNQCDLAANACDWSRLDAYLTEASTVADSVLVNLNPTEFVEGTRPLAELKPMLELILRSLKAKYPRVRYVEAFNEPDWQFHGLERRQGRPAAETTLQPGELYGFYVPFYEAVKKVNTGLRPSERLRLGGPALTAMDPTWLEPFLDGYAADRNPLKRLDFISYHSYLAWDDDYQRPTLYKDDLRVVASDRATMRAWLKERRIATTIPTFVTETGIYPGPAFDESDPTNDYLRQAAGLATFGYWYSHQPDTYMFNWCVRHRVEERKDQIVTRTPGGPLHGTFTPYGNMLAMQSKMKTTRVRAVSPRLEEDNGVYAIAAKDTTGASLMVWNWQHVHDRSYRTTIDMSRLPANLRHGPVHQRTFRIDRTTSNYFGDPGTANLQLVDHRIVRPGASYTQRIELSPNAIYLILLERA